MLRNVWLDWEIKNRKNRNNWQTVKLVVEITTDLTEINQIIYFEQFLVVPDSFMSAWHETESSEKSKTQLRKCLHTIWL